MVGNVDSDNKYAERTYRERISPEGLTCFNVVERESDLYICAETNLEDMAHELLIEAREEIESYLKRDPMFERTLVPVDPLEDTPPLVQKMIDASNYFNVGPMAAVAGAVAQFVGQGLLECSSRVMVENGGDVFVAGEGACRAAVYAGENNPSIDIIVEGGKEGIGICTSSATVGPSLSMGSADAVTIISRTAVIADAAATAFSNSVRSVEDIEPVIRRAADEPEITGIVIVMGDRIGMWGELQLG